MNEVISQSRGLNILIDIAKDVKWALENNGGELEWDNGVLLFSRLTQSELIKFISQFER